MKKLINAIDAVVPEALAGMAAAHPDELRVDAEHRVIYRATPKAEGKVALVSGGGSGHEPLHGGFVGTGMLDAACAGEIFTSPVPDQIAAATSEVDRGAGVLHIVKNYTGDVMNFEMAAEMVDMESGIKVATVVTNDDVAVEDSLYTAGRRGVGVTVLVEKIAGAAAEEGQPLEEVARIASAVNAAGRSMGMALTSCTVPANGKPSFDLPEDEMEIGIGIHGEPGRHREPIAPAAEIAKRLVEPILAELPAGDGIVTTASLAATRRRVVLYLPERVQDAEGFLFEDDGVSDAYRTGRGLWLRWRVEADAEQVRVRTERAGGFVPAWGEVEFVLRPGDDRRVVTV